RGHGRAGDACSDRRAAHERLSAHGAAGRWSTGCLDRAGRHIARPRRVPPDRLMARGAAEEGGTGSPDAAARVRALESRIRVAAIELREIALPLREPFRISSGAVSERRILLVRVSDGDGITVWSECVAGEHPNYSPETVDTAWLALRDWVAPRLLGAGLMPLGDVGGVLAGGVRGHR